MERCLAAVVDNREVAAGHHRLRLEAPHVAARARAGQFVHVLPRDAATSDPLLRRAFSVLATDDTTFDILFRVQGRGTARMASVRAGDALDILGPLGVPFSMPEPECSGAADAAVETKASARQSSLLSPRVILVGGGVGVPPLAMLAAQIRQDRGDSKKSVEVTALIGARSRADVICLHDFERCSTHVQIATDDGSLGRRGLVTQMLEEQLSTSERKTPHEPGAPAPGEERRDIVYACGPLPMLRAVARICAAHHVPCQISLEENMPCGVGVCNGCVVRVAQADDEYGHYRRVCVDGPVMWASDVAWDEV